MVNVVPREVPRPRDLPRHNIHHDTHSPKLPYSEGMDSHAERDKGIFFRIADF